MTLEEYVESAKKEIDKFQRQWEKGRKKNPENYPEELDKDEWRDQEHVYRFEGM